MILIFFTDLDAPMRVKYAEDTLRIDSACVRIILDASHIIIIPLQRIKRIEVIFD